MPAPQKFILFVVLLKSPLPSAQPPPTERSAPSLSVLSNVQSAPTVMPPREPDVSASRLPASSP